MNKGYSLRQPGVRAVLTLLLCGLALVPVPAAHSIKPWDIAPYGQHVTPPRWDQTSGEDQAAQQWLQTLEGIAGAWQTVQPLRWFGRALWLRQFSLPQDLGKAAQLLTQTSPVLDRVLTGPGTLLLSGNQGNLHLVVQLQRSPQGVSGFASALDVSPSRQDTSTPTADAALAWLAPDTQVHAAQWVLADGAQLSQFIHAVPQAPEPMRARLRTILARQGWVETPATTGDRDAQWQRGGDRLLLMPDRSGRGSLLYQTLIAGGSP